MSISTKSSGSSNKPSETAQILEHVELLVALYEEQGDRSPKDLGNLLEVQADEIARTLENRLERRFAELENRIEKITEALGESGQSPESSAAREEQQRELDETLQKVTDRFSEKTDTIAGMFKTQIQQMFDDLGTNVARVSEGISRQQSEMAVPVFAPSTDDSVSHWHKQKEAMLSKYGIDPDYRPVTDQNPTDAPVHNQGPLEASPAEPTLTMSEFDAAAVEELKDRLNEKLREAEVEMSISRAKISQHRAELEAHQVELDRRESAIQAKYEAVAQAPKRRLGLFRWLWFHLKPKPPEVNDRA